MLSVLVAAAIMSTQPNQLAQIDPVPSKRQLSWHEMGYYAFTHFGPNTFTGEEWGHGTEDPNIFHPAHLDCRQWAHAFKLAGMKGIIITAKHHDGFCLWPSKYSTHTVAQSKLMDGKGDVLKELSAACRAEGLKMGVYLSPWDRNHPKYGTPEYNDVFKHMLREVLTHYGPIFEVWFDGANGEGPNGKKQVYDWPGFVQVVRECQPDAVIFSDGGPDIRWVGNENGFAGETNWGMIDKARYVPGTDHSSELTEGKIDGPDWVPSECDVSIRPGWFWRESENAKVKSVKDLMEIWYGSVGRGSNLLLNVPPNSSGLISDEDVSRLMEFKEAREAQLGNPAKIVAVAASSSRGTGFEASRAGDGKNHTFWAAPDGDLTATLNFDLRPGGFDVVRLREPIQLGQRVKSFELQAEYAGAWTTIGKGTTINREHMLRVGKQNATRVRLLIHDARACPAISEVAFFLSGK